MIESSTNYVYKSIAVSADVNPHILSGSIAHGGVALLWKRTIDDFVTPLENIESDRIEGIRCDFDNCDPLFILSVYLPSSNSTIDEFKEYLDFLWALYYSLSDKGHVLVLGDFNGDLGDSLGDKGKYPPNQRGSKLLDFANYFNLCPSNLLSNCNGPLETYISDSGRHRSTLDYIFVPNCLLGNIISSITFDMQIENTSDHLPVTLELNYPTSSLDIIADDFASDLESNPKCDWSKFSQEEISEKYITPLVNQLENINIAECLDSNDSAETITNLLLQNSVSLAKKNFKTNKKNKGFVRLPEEVKVARYHGKVAFDDWKQLNFPLEGDAHDIYRAKRKDYRSKLRDFLNHLEADKMKSLCNAADCNEKLFWKLLKGQKSFSKMSAFLVNGNLLTDRNVIRDVWADHFEALGTPTENEYFDNAFLSRVVSGVREIFDSCTNNPFGVLCEPLDYDEVACVCFKLKLGVTGLCIDYEHISFASPPVWRLLFEMYQNF